MFHIRNRKVLLNNSLLVLIEFIFVDYFQLLSDELILSILKYLPRSSLAAMAQVCRRLRSLT